MRYRIISAGKIKEAFYLNGIKEYLKRLQPYAGIELVDGLEEKTNPRAGESEINRVLDREGERILKLVGDNDILVALDIQGSSISSEAFAQLVDRWNLSGKSRVNLVIGGSHGLSEEVKRRANYRLSFSPMTFPH
ncbi:MAG TPA: 23S rRNA (pseudouridine(1915)-N(3))-methyltransferase RlmH, partial [Syntrophomonas sp.]|nr:23S rRNA (pseudouridine(1915)-N(3))-methyltransferase RlmH [Syntrophomonas sp.]